MSSPSGSAQRAELHQLLQTHAVLRGDFTLASGQRSAFYLDARLVTLSARGSALVGEMMLDAAMALGAEAVAGLTVGADPIVAAVATTAGGRRIAMDGLIVRKEQKLHGAGKQIEGPWRDGLAVAIVDDTLTTGSSALTAVDIVTAAGGDVRGIIALIDREQGAREAIEGRGYIYRALFVASELVL